MDGTALGKPAGAARTRSPGHMPKPGANGHAAMEALQGPRRPLVFAYYERTG